jgi:hypothetical protein
VNDGETSDREELDRIVESFVRRIRVGEEPEIREYLTRFPEHAAEIEELFPTIRELESLGAESLDGETDATARAPMEAAPELGDYRILSEIGRGGMGVVYEAEQLSLGRHVALKVLPGPSCANQETLERFRREAQSVARLHHTNIVPVYEVGAENGIHYYAMQFVRGRSLREVLVDLRALRSDGGDAPAELTTTSVRDHAYWLEIARIGEQVADALHYAHEEGVLHRDIKPANIILDARGTAWVADFGLAKSRDHDLLTGSGTPPGTIPYMAPERFEGSEGPRSDVYGLGVTLYELLTLRRAFEGTDPLQVLRRIQSQDPPRPRRLAPRIPRDLETIVLKAMVRDPRQRYASAAELGEDLGRFRKGETIRARRSGPMERARKWARRRPAAAALTAVSLLALLGVLGGALWHTQRLREALSRLEAESARREVAVAELERAGAREEIRRIWSVVGFTRVPIDPETIVPPVGVATRSWLWAYMRRLPEDRRPIACETRVCGGSVVYDLAYSPNGTYLACAGGGRAVELWRVTDMAPVFRAPTPTPRCFCLDFRADGGLLAAGGDEGWVHLVKIPGGAVRSIRLEGGTVESVQFLADDEVLAVLREGRIVVLRTKDGSVVRVLRESGPELLCGRAHTTTGLLAVGSVSGRVSFLSPETGRTQAEDVVLSGNVLDLRFSGDGSLLVALGNGEARVFRLDPGVRLHGILPSTPGIKAALVPDPELDEWVLVTTGAGGRMEMNGIRSVCRYYRTSVVSGYLSAVALSPDGRQLALAGDNGELSFLNIKD